MAGESGEASLGGNAALFVGLLSRAGAVTERGLRKQWL